MVWRWFLTKPNVPARRKWHGWIRPFVTVSEPVDAGGKSDALFQVPCISSVLPQTTWGLVVRLWRGWWLGSGLARWLGPLGLPLVDNDASPCGPSIPSPLCGQSTCHAHLRVVSIFCEHLPQLFMTPANTCQHF